MHEHALEKDKEFEKVELELCFGEAAFVGWRGGRVGVGYEEEVCFPLKAAEETLRCLKVGYAGCGNG